MLVRTGLGCASCGGKCGGMGLGACLYSTDANGNCVGCFADPTGAGGGCFTPNVSATNPGVITSGLAVNANGDIVAAPSVPSVGVVTTTTVPVNTTGATTVASQTVQQTTLSNGVVAANSDIMLGSFDLTQFLGSTFFGVPVLVWGAH